MSHAITPDGTDFGRVERTQLILVAMAIAALPGGLYADTQQIARAGTVRSADCIGHAGPDGLLDLPSLQWAFDYPAGHMAASDKPHRPLPESRVIARKPWAYCQAQTDRCLDQRCQIRAAIVPRA